MPTAVEPAPSVIQDIKDAAKSQPAVVDSVSSALSAAKSRFFERNPVSFKLHEQALLSLPGGNTRTALFTAPFPLSMKRGKGHMVYDEDGHEYCDFVGELTAGLYGHSHPVIQEVLIKTIHEVGLNLGSTTAQEVKYAALLCSRFNLERIRFTNSGTESNLHALAAARRFTGKRKVVVFTGGYHGGVLSFGDGVAPNNVDQGDWVLSPYNDVASAKTTIEQTEGLAAVLVEGMQGGGCFQGTKEFLMTIQESAKMAGAIFILDEVMTSRLAPGGLQSIHGIEPDLTTFGKYLGGGMTFGAFGGKASIMSVFDPRLPGSLAHSGTFNNNTLAMHAGYAGLSRLYTAEANLAFNAKGDRFRTRLQEVTRGTKMSFTGRGSMLCVHFTTSGLEDIRSKDDVEELWELKDLFWLEIMEDGFWMTKRGLIALILDMPQEELDRFVDSVTGFLKRHAQLVALAA